MTNEAVAAKPRTSTERLAFGPGQRYEAVEAAIHLNRYLLAKPVCVGRRVLDIACGEGYGAYLMAERWGAASVVGVDAAEQAIAAARQYFASSRIEYVCHVAETLDELFPTPEFDLIVSLETIEHLHGPEQFLAAAARALRPGGVIILSCPNDYWYYRTPEECNPFHTRKYTFNEFREMVEGVLGPARGYLLGAPAAGFMNLAGVNGVQAEVPADPRSLLEAGEEKLVLVLPTEERISPEMVRYFVGIWGPPTLSLPRSAAIYPVSMDASLEAVRSSQIENLRDEVRSLRTQVYEAEKQLRLRAPSEAALEVALQDLRAQLQAAAERTAALEREKRHAELRLAALQAENEYMHEEAFRTRRHLEWLEGQSARAQRRVEDLETYIASQRQTIADQARLVDERDAYIRELEARVNEMSGQIALLRSSPLNRGAHFVRRLLRGSR